jgi:tetratricopeptide (TPR) repeat protein
MGRTGSGIGLDFAQDDVVYPSLLSIYTKAPVGTLGIVNHENAELRNVEVSFRAQDYTASEFICGTIPLLARERQEAMPLYADFSPRLMDFTENGRIAGELVFRYSYLGERRESVQSAVLQIAHRNSVPLGDPEALAALVSPTAPEILEYGKHVIGLSNTQVWSVVHKNMKSAIWLFEGLLAAGLRQEDSGSSAPSGMVEDIQYPAQTLAYRSGSAMDIGLAYAAALEASGIPSAFIFQEDDFIVLFYLNITPDAAEKTFNGTTDLIIDGDEVWMPLSMASFNEGFSKSWKAAPPRIKGEAIIMQNAWDRYPPAPFPALGVRSAMPDEQELKVRAEAALDGYIATDIQPLIDAKQKQIKEAGPGQDLAVLYNQLGILYARKGDMGAATTAYTEAAKKGSVSAANNLGNMALREKNFATARRWFEEALRLRPDNPAALQGLEKIRQRSRE